MLVFLLPWWPVQMLSPWVHCSRRVSPQRLGLLMCCQPMLSILIRSGLIWMLPSLRNTNELLDSASAEEVSQALFDSRIRLYEVHSVRPDAIWLSYIRPHWQCSAANRSTAAGKAPQKAARASLLVSHRQTQLSEPA